MFTLFEFESKKTADFIEFTFIEVEPENEPPDEIIKRKIIEEPAIDAPILLPVEDIPAVLESKPETETTFTIRADSLPEPADSSAIIEEAITDFIRKRMPVPFALNYDVLFLPDSVSVLSYAADTTNIYSRTMRRLLSGNVSFESTPEEIRTMRNDQIMERYYSKKNNDILPLGFLFGLGAKLLNKGFRKALPDKKNTEYSKILSFKEIRIMIALWSLKEATPSEIYKHLPLEEDFTIQVVMNNLKNLTRIGVITETASEYENTYSPLLSKEDLIREHYNEMVRYSISTAGVENNNGDSNLIENLRLKILLLSDEKIYKKYLKLKKDKEIH